MYAKFIFTLKQNIINSLAHWIQSKSNWHCRGYLGAFQDITQDNCPRHQDVLRLCTQHRCMCAPSLRKLEGWLEVPGHPMGCCWVLLWNLWGQDWGVFWRHLPLWPQQASPELRALTLGLIVEGAGSSSGMGGQVPSLCEREMWIIMIPFHLSLLYLFS